jgi:hypothetical protein
MSASLAEQFEGFAECCLRLPRSAKTSAGRARFIQMADEYRIATLLIQERSSEVSDRVWFDPDKASSAAS